MRIIICLLVISLMSSCKTAPKFYTGYIYNTNKKPLYGVKVSEQYFEYNYTETDSTGHFKLKKDQNRIGNLLINYENISQTVRTYGSQGGERLIYSFVEGKNDTLFLKI